MTKTVNKTKKKTGKCIEIKLKKYQTRKSPPFHAGDCPGQTKKGKDGTYVSRRDIKNIYRWVKISTGKIKTKARTKASMTTKIESKMNITVNNPANNPANNPVNNPVDKSKGPLYEIHDNGGRPFLVQVFNTGDKVAIYSQNYDEHTENPTVDVDKLISITPYQKIFIGENTDKSQHIGKQKGNSILLQLSQGEYQFIGWKVQTFKTPDADVITKYYSPIGNSDVPYPFAIGNKYTYLLIENMYIPNELLDFSQLKMNPMYPYHHYYGHLSKEGMADIKNNAKSMHLKTVVKRRY